MGSSLITPDPGTIIWTVITFVILAFLLGRFAWKPLLQLLEERERTVKDSLDSARKAREEAERTLKKNQELLSRARGETEAIIEHGKREAEALKFELLTRARNDAQELVEQGRKQIRFEQKQAIEALRKQVADLAIGAAERLVEKSLDEPRQRKLVEDYMRDLAASLPEERSR